MGYVDTYYANRAYSSVISDINVYANWASYTKANISIGGIFFDDVVGPNAATKDVVTYYKNVSLYAYAKVLSDVTAVVFNPGMLGPQQLFSYCGLMVEFESPVSAYHNDTTLKRLPGGYQGQSAIIIYNSTTATDVESLVHTMINYKLRAAYLEYGSRFDDRFSDWSL